MTIKEVSEMYGLSRETLRYYESVGIIPSVTRKSNGIRNYCEKDLAWVELAAKIAVKTVSRFLEDNKNSFDLVEWVLFDSVTESVYEKEVDKLYS